MTCEGGSCPAGIPVPAHPYPYYLAFVSFSHGSYLSRPYRNDAEPG